MAAARLGTAAPAGCRPRRAALDGQPQGIRRGAVGRELARGHGRGPAGEAVGRGVSSCEASPPPFPVTSRPPRGRWRLSRRGAGARPQPRPQRVQVGPGSPEGRGGGGVLRPDVGTTLSLLPPNRNARLQAQKCFLGTYYARIPGCSRLGWGAVSPLQEGSRFRMYGQTQV